MHILSHHYSAIDSFYYFYCKETSILNCKASHDWSSCLFSTAWRYNNAKLLSDVKKGNNMKCKEYLSYSAVIHRSFRFSPSESFSCKRNYPLYIWYCKKYVSCKIVVTNLGVLTPVGDNQQASCCLVCRTKIYFARFSPIAGFILKQWFQFTISRRCGTERERQRSIESLTWAT